MKRLNASIRSKLKVVAATATAIFSLTSVFISTLAWFNSNALVNISGMGVSVVTSNCNIEGVNLYKFEYAENTFGTGRELDYFSPQDGAVNRYPYVEQEGFGVDAMNVYDPIEKIIAGNSFSLRKLNCNAIYEVTLQSNSFDLASLTANAFILNDRIPQGNEKALSEYVDFDLFSQDELNDFNNGTWNLKLYNAQGEPKYLPSTYLTPLNIVLTASGAPSDTVGYPGDRYLNTATDDLYVKGIPSWGSAEVITKGSVAPTDAGNDGEYYLDTTAHKLYQYSTSESEWMEVSISYTGNGVPSSTIGGTKDYYLDLTNNDLYIKSTGSWGNPVTTNISSGADSPDETGEENEGDYYVETTNHVLYRYMTNGWTIIERTYFGNGEPEIVGTKDDLYLDNLTRDLYVKGTSVWTDRTNLEEEKLYYKISYLSDIKENAFWSLREDISSGEGTPNPASGSAGDYYLDTTNDDLYIKAPTSWGNPVAVTRGVGSPEDAAEDGTFYIETAEHTLYQYSAANEEWSTVAVSLSGRGSPDANAGNPGDYYIDIANNDLYIKAPTSWGNPLPATKGNEDPVVSNLRKEGDFYIKTDTDQLFVFQEHAHFYNEGSPTLADAKDVDFHNDQIVLYVNVNYAPAQLDEYAEEVYKGNITAIYDFAFSFMFSSRGN